MADRTSIEWTDATWNPIRAARYVPLPGAGESDLGDLKRGWHCEKVSPGCANCYAEPINRRLGTGLDYKPGHRASLDVFLDERALDVPLRWKRPRKIFVGSMTDLFADFVADEMLDRVFAMMALCPQHVFQLLTKRPARMRRYLNDPRTARRIWDEVCDRVVAEEMPVVLTHKHLADVERVASFPASLPRVEIGRWPLPNVWLGVSAEDQQRADERIPELLATPAAVRWISAEPLLGPVDLASIDDGLKDGVHLIFDALTGLAHDGEESVTGIFGQPDPRIDWVIAGGESGPNARPMHPDWARRLRDLCAHAGTPFLFKQWGEFAPAFDHDLKPLRGKPWTGAAQRAVARGEATLAEATVRVGRKTAGRLLDGVLHDAFPAAIAEART